VLALSVFFGSMLASIEEAPCLSSQLQERRGGARDTVKLVTGLVTTHPLFACLALDVALTLALFVPLSATSSLLCMPSLSCLPRLISSLSAYVIIVKFVLFPCSTYLSLASRLSLASLASIGSLTRLLPLPSVLSLPSHPPPPCLSLHHLPHLLLFTLLPLPALNGAPHIGQG
jgi:hypothetical protein